MRLKPNYGLALLGLLIAIPLFAHLDEVPIQLWDEGRCAVKALEMSTSQNWWVTTVNGMPDMWSVKPPLFTWVQAIFIKLLGANELAVRLPSALAGAGVLLMMYWFFAWKYIKDAWLGIFSGLLLVTSLGFITLHGSRSGDYDNMLTLFTTGYVLFFFLYLQEGKVKYLHVTMALLLFAAYTKGIQGLIFLPALILYAIIARKAGMLFKQKYFYIGGITVAVLAVGYYFIREHYNPGYIKTVMDNELGARYGKVIEGHNGTFFYFFEWIKNRAFAKWYPALILACVVTLFSNDGPIRRLVGYLTLVAGFYLFIISSAQTKCWWYIMPLMPFMAMITATIIDSLFKVFFVVGEGARPVMRQLLPFSFLIILFIQPYVDIINVTLAPPPKELWDYVNGDIAQVLRNVSNGDVSLDGYVVVGTYEDNVMWYANLIKQQHKPVRFIEGNDPGHAKMVIAYRPQSKHFIDSVYNAKVIYSFGDVDYYQLEGRK